MAYNTTDPHNEVLVRTNFFSKREISELPNLLMPGERVLAMISGIYTAGTAVLCVTTRRVLLVDKKMIRLSIEDMRFDSIKEVNYSHQAVMASVQFFYVGRSQQFEFKSWHRNELRQLAQMVQQKMFDVTDRAQGRRTDSLQKQVKVAEGVTKVSEPEATKPVVPANSVGYYGSNEDIEKYLSDRIARWRKASRFVDTLTMSTKTGRQILELEAPLAKR
jgi:hypothetical protein